MAIDISALRKFQQVWGPVIDSIPAVIDMVQREADLDRDIQIKKREYDKAQADIDASFTEANKRLTAINDAMAAAIERKKMVEDEIEAAVSVAAKNAEEVKRQKEEALSVVQTAIVAEQAKLQNLQSEYDTKRAAAEAAHQEMMSVMQAEVKALESKRASAEKALEALKAKLG